MTLDQNNYINLSKAGDLANPWQRRLYRFFEMLPGIVAWATLIGVVIISWLYPIGAAIFIIVFDVYWLLRVIYFSFHLRSSYQRMRENMKIDWVAKLKSEKSGWEKIYHLIILPVYKEDISVVDETFDSLVKCDYPKDKMIVVLALEDRAGDQAKLIGEKIKQKYGNLFGKFLITSHPADIVGELAGKGSNVAHSAREVKKLIDTEKIPYENIICSVFDIDTRAYEHYFSRLSYVFLETPDNLRSSFQPIPIYNNNIWHAPLFSRVVAMSATFWHMMQQERPERLASFSSHSLSFKSAVDMDFWPVGNVSEDSRIFWRAMLAFDGHYKTVPLFYPVSMDANLANSVWRTMINIYKQQRRWGWGVENVPYWLYGCLKNKKMPLSVKIRFSFNQLESFWSWATNALIIFLMGWTPLILGGQRFNVTLLAGNLPQITRYLMTVAMLGLITSAIYSTMLLPPRPGKYHRGHNLLMIVQWIFVPISIVIFGALPGLEAQTRLLFGKYMGFWVTEKHR